MQHLVRELCVKHNVMISVYPGRTQSVKSI